MFERCALLRNMPASLLAWSFDVDVDCWSYCLPLSLTALQSSGSQTFLEHSTLSNTFFSYGIPSHPIPDLALLIRTQKLIRLILDQSE